jgi:2-amino-4-hydroxy-6-hydroxymethyldihydropteridine diphosphokinase
MSGAEAGLGFDAIVALGSNQGDKEARIAEAIQHLEEAGDMRIVARSRNYRTAPWGKLDQDWFVNACVSVATDLSARELLKRCQAIESRMGRVREEHWGPRVIDLDVLVYRDVVSDEAELTLPHPGIMERAFVLVPLADVAPDLMIKGRTVLEWLSRVDHADVLALP